MSPFERQPLLSTSTKIGFVNLVSIRGRMLADYQGEVRAGAYRGAGDSRGEDAGEASKAAQSALKLSEDVYRAGLADFPGVLDAQGSLLELVRAIAQAHTSARVRSVLLFKALAGGRLVRTGEDPNSRAGWGSNPLISTEMTLPGGDNAIVDLATASPSTSS